MNIHLTYMRSLPDSRTYDVITNKLTFQVWVDFSRSATKKGYVRSKAATQQQACKQAKLVTWQRVRYQTNIIAKCQSPMCANTAKSPQLGIAPLNSVNRWNCNCFYSSLSSLDEAVLVVFSRPIFTCRWCISPYSDSLRVERSRGRIPVGARFSALVQTGPGAHPAFYTMGTWVTFPGVKLSGRGVDHPPHLAPRLKKE